MKKKLRIQVEHGNGVIRFSLCLPMLRQTNQNSLLKIEGKNRLNEIEGIKRLAFFADMAMLATHVQRHCKPVHLLRQSVLAEIFGQNLLGWSLPVFLRNKDNIPAEI